MFTLDHMKKMSTHYAYPFNQLNMIHVGGTNGKGSTSTMIYHILKETYHVGLYTSPYDTKRFDNIKINEKTISDLDIQAYMTTYKEAFQRFQLSEFEIDTWIALMWFYDQKVDYAVIEVGLGGKEDATNVITPILSVITNVGYDHMDVLGKDIKDIACAKAGIIKHGVPIIIGSKMNHEALPIISSVANQKQAELIISDELDILSKTPLTFRYGQDIYTYENLPYYQHENIALSLKVISYLILKDYDIKMESIKQGLQAFHMPKRFQILSKKPLMIMDGAHNLEGIKALIESLKALEIKEEPTIILSVLKDKPYEAMLNHLCSFSKHVHLFQFEHERALDINNVKQEHVVKHDHLNDIKSLIQNPYVVITGSLYFLREIDLILKEILT